MEHFGLHLDNVWNRKVHVLKELKQNNPKYDI